MAKKVGTQELEARWQKVLEDYASSGCGVSQYCQEHKVSKASLYKWSQRLGIPLKNRSALVKTYQINKNNDPTSSVNQEKPFPFIELKLPASNVDASFPLKLELFLTQERKLRIETASTWEQVVDMVKALVS